MKINKKMKASLLVGLSSTLVLASVPLLNSNVLATTYKNDNIKAPNNTSNELNAKNITVGTDQSFKNDLDKLGFFGNKSSVSNTDVNFWFDTANNTINIDTSKEVVNSDHNVTENLMPSITIKVTSSNGDVKNHDIKSEKKPSTVQTKTNASESTSQKIYWKTPATDGDNGWKPATEAGGSSRQSNSKTGAENKSANTKYKLTLKKGDKATVNLKYILYHTDKKDKDFQYTSTTPGSNVVRTATTAYKSADSLNLGSKKISETQDSWTQYDQAFVMKVAKKDAASGGGTTRSRRQAGENAPSTTTSKSTLFFPTNDNYSKETIDNSSSIRNLDINWENLWKQKDANTLHTYLQKEPTSAKGTLTATTDIFSFTKLTKDDDVTIDKAFGWADTDTNTYSLKYSGTVKSGYNFENLYENKDYKIKDQKFNHLITMDFNTRGITRVDLDKSSSAIPSYVFDIKQKETSKNLLTGSETTTPNDPYAVVPNKNPQKIGLVGNKNWQQTPRTTSNNPVDDTKFNAWVDQNGLNVRTEVAINGTTEEKQKMEIKYTAYDKYLKKQEEKTISGANLTGTNEKYFGWDKSKLDGFITTDEKPKTGSTQTQTSENLHLLPVNENTPMLEVQFTYVEKSTSATSPPRQTRSADNSSKTPNSNPPSNTTLRYLDKNDGSTGGSGKNAKTGPGATTETLKEAVTDLKMSTKNVKVDTKDKTKSTTVIVYRSADGMNHMLWDTTKTTETHPADESGGESAPRLFANTKAPSTETFIKSDYNISTAALNKKIKELSSQGKSLEEIITKIRTDESFANTIDVIGRNAPAVNITMTPDNTNDSIKFNISTKNLDATGIVTEANKDPVVSGDKVLINGETTTGEFFINKNGDWSSTPFITPSAGLAAWAIALIVVSAVLVVGLSVFAFIKYRKRS